MLNIQSVNVCVFLIVYFNETVNEKFVTRGGSNNGIFKSMT